MTKDRPTVGEMPLDSVIAQINSLSAYPVDVAAVLGLDRLPVPVNGLDVVDFLCLVISVEPLRFIKRGSAMLRNAGPSRQA